ncbi:hypothetical protein ACLI4U_02075 [Natrialbaceae archaeon A-CW2]|uniref:hypothetical protein n=1 Tax=Natronosalvus amylolyticus TaxID=2961994 RepID=UPI0020C9439A|nr:hypothetical protein [Natronosalvus amylolyticus]
MGSGDSIDRSHCDELEFPSGASREDCLTAIGAVQTCIYGHDGATKDEILEILVPEEQYPIAVKENDA